MLYGVERKSSHALSRIVTKLVGDKTVAQLMQSNADKRRNDRKQNTQQDTPVKSAYHIGK